MAKVKAWLKKAGHLLLGPVGVLLLIVGAVIATMLGVKGLQIGGLIGLLLGKKTPDQKAIDVANSIPKDRVGPDGKLIPIGTSDEHGMTQAAVVAIDSTGLFSNPDTVTFTPPGGEKVEVQLPTGVKASDVEHVLVIQPGQFAVTVKDSSSIRGSDVDDLLERYGK